ncbi:YibE/F family protein [Nonomuraea roseola]|uniref:YibE/F family protein n=1 Tax=Nonomuraea roseola TaxID=46179 RepID=UPI0031F86685
MGAAFALAVVAFGRWRGVTALVGLGVTFTLLLLFVIPAILAGEPPLAIAIVGSRGDHARGALSHPRVHADHLDGGPGHPQQPDPHRAAVLRRDRTRPSSTASPTRARSTWT